MPTQLLVVDDDPAVTEFVRRTLATPNRIVTVAATLAAARAHLASGFTPDLLLIDRVMRDGSGLVLCGEFRRAYPEVPVILMTGYARASHDEQAAHMVLEKPFTPNALRFAVTRLLASRPVAILMDTPSRAEPPGSALG